MKKMKRTAAILLALVMLMSMLPLTASAAPSAVRSKRIVSVVYDDSGSMKAPADKAVRANYAMQAFIGMLDRNDAMFITYMGNADKAKTIDLTRPEQEVETVRKHTSDASTPVGAVATAFKALKNYPDKNENTQYWLLVFTDGDYSDEKQNQFQRRLEKYAGTSMPNGSLPHIQYMTIGDERGEFTPSATKSNIAVKQAISNQDITQNIFDISSEISGRFRVDDSKIKFVDDKTVEITADIPLLNIGILTQNTKAKVVSVQTAEKAAVPIKTNVAIRAPGKENSSSEGASKEALSLKGNVATAGMDDKNMPAGKYTISFNAAVKPENVVIMYEPALELRIKLLRNDKELDDKAQVSGNQKGLKAKAVLFEAGTNNEIDMSLLPSGGVSKMVHTEAGKEIETSDTMEMDPVTVTNGVNVITAEYSIAGYITLTAKKEFNAATVEISDIKAEIFNDGTPRRSKQDGSNVVYVSDMKNNKTGVKFTVYDKGKPITKQQAEQMYDKFLSSITADLTKYEVEVMKDGSFLVYPTKKTKFFGNLTCYLKNRGERTVSAKLGKKQAQEKLIIKAGSLAPFIIPPLILAYVLWQIFGKKRFSPNTVVKLYRGKRSDDYMQTITYPRKTAAAVSLNPFSSLIPVVGPLLNPFPSRKKIGPFTVKPTQCLLQKMFTGVDRSVLVTGLKKCGVSTTSQTPRVDKNKNGPSAVELTKKLYIAVAKGSGKSYYKFETK